MAAHGARQRPPAAERQGVGLFAPQARGVAVGRLLLLCFDKSGFVGGAGRHPCRPLRVGCAARAVGLQATTVRGFGEVISRQGAKQNLRERQPFAHGGSSHRVSYGSSSLLIDLREHGHVSASTQARKRAAKV